MWTNGYCGWIQPTIINKLRQQYQLNHDFTMISPRCSNLQPLNPLDPATISESPSIASTPGLPRRWRHIASTQTARGQGWRHVMATLERHQGVATGGHVRHLTTVIIIKLVNLGTVSSTFQEVHLVNDKQWTSLGRTSLWRTSLEPTLNQPLNMNNGCVIMTQPTGFNSHLPLNHLCIDGEQKVYGGCRMVAWWIMVYTRRLKFGK